MQDIAHTICVLMQCNAHLQQCFIALLESICILTCEHQTSLNRPPQRVDIAQTTQTLFNVGLKQKCNFTRSDVTFLHSFVQVHEPRASTLTPCISRRSDHLLGKQLAARQMSCRYQCRRRVKIGRADLKGFFGSSHCVTKFEAGIPDRIPHQ